MCGCDGCDGWMGVMGGWVCGCDGCDGCVGVMGMMGVMGVMGVISMRGQGTLSGSQVVSYDSPNISIHNRHSKINKQHSKHFADDPLNKSTNTQMEMNKFYCCKEVLRNNY